MEENTYFKKHYGGVECRICGLNFIPDSDEDQERHEEEHRRLIWGGMPLEIREFLKSFGWAVAHNDGGIERLKEKFISETGKRAVVFAWWKRAVSNGVPENDFDKYMAAHFALVDAMVSRDQAAITKAQQGVERWESYA